MTRREVDEDFGRQGLNGDARPLELGQTYGWRIPSPACDHPGCRRQSAYACRRLYWEGYALAVGDFRVLTLDVSLGRLVERDAVRSALVDVGHGSCDGEPPTFEQLASLWGLTMTQLDAALRPYFRPVKLETGRSTVTSAVGGVRFTTPRCSRPSRRQAVQAHEWWREFRTRHYERAR